MTRISRVAMAALFLFLAAAARAEAEEPGSALLAGISRKYGAAKRFSARFRQEVPLQNVGVVRKASGEVFFERPLKMRWNYRGTEAQLFLADGEYFYFRPPDSPQVFRRKIDEKSLGGKIPLLLLFGKGDISRMFRADEVVRRKDGAETALRLIPRDDGASEVRRVDLVVSSADLSVREVHIYDRLGGANHLYLEGAVIDPSFPPGFFRFRKPADAEVVDG